MICSILFASVSTHGHIYSVYVWVDYSCWKWH